ncbi:hypothetical protein GIY56_09505 [Paracoccus sp. YIM 132242]|uniref:Uncharacterized protein n=1 Tax=Paracoccus lichenicola TaxID=2665644 RepID=A0A6L6HQP5_9RHOB|nr:hypothetical protein [Paracoccus lichenicola]MTE00523.1 hypothetical protein [Paracoccus lichenicola]
MLKITGTRGSWMATVQGYGKLPVIHNHRMNWNTQTYSDPFKDRVVGMKKVDEWHAALETGDLLVVQRGVKDATGNETTERDGYIGVFRYTGYRRIDENGGIELLITERISR